MKRILTLIGLLAFAVPALALDANGSQVSCPTSAGGIALGTAAKRLSVCVYNEDTTNPVYINKAGSTAGYKVPAGQGRCFDSGVGQSMTAGQSSASVQTKCISTGGTVVVDIWEVWE